MSKIIVAYKGCVENSASLPLAGNTLGDFYTVKEDGLQYYWSIVAPIGTINDWKPINVPEVTAASPWIINTLSTVDATPTTIATIVVPDNTTYLIMADVVSRRTNGSDRGGFARRAVVYREGGGPAILMNYTDTDLTKHSTVGHNVLVIVSGNNALIQVVGSVGHNIDWKSRYIVNSVG